MSNYLLCTPHEKKVILKEFEPSHIDYCRFGNSNFGLTGSGKYWVVYFTIDLTANQLLIRLSKYLQNGN